jgi:hypothetical protein
MSDTPEADAAVLASDWGWSLVLKETCRRLERERDKAEAGWSECREFAQRVVDERNKLREALEKISNLSQITCLSFEAQSFKATSIACFALADIEKEVK